MNKIFTKIILIIGLLTITNAQGIKNTLGTADATSSFDVQDMNALPLARVQGNGWTGFLDAIPPQHPFHVSSGYFDDTGDWLQPVGLFENTVTGKKDGYGVAGLCDDTSDNYGIGVYGRGNYRGVIGEVNSTGTDNDNEYTGVSGYVEGGSGLNYGVFGGAFKGYKAFGGFFVGAYASDLTFGVRGEAVGSPENSGVYGFGGVAASGGYSAGVVGVAEGANAINYGVVGHATDATLNWAGYFYGDVGILGTLNKAAGAFKIDHPLDPENKYLSHSFVESPDMMNIYNGNAELNYAGEVEIELPDWFESLNNDFRYQLTAIGAPGPNLYVAQKVNGNTFSIAGGAPGMEVSWQITGIRKDAYANAHRIKVEENKTSNDIGKYLHPEAFGRSKLRGINYNIISQDKQMLSKDKKQMKMRK